MGAYINRANTLRKMDKPGQAIIDYQAALKFDPIDPDVNLGLALTYDECGEAGKESYQK